MPNRKQIKLDVGCDDVVIVLSPTEELNDDYAVQLSIPNHIEDKLEKNDEEIPPYVLVGFQICQYIANPDNMEKVDCYFQEQMDKSMRELAEAEEKNGIVD